MSTYSKDWLKDIVFLFIMIWLSVKKIFHILSWYYVLNSILKSITNIFQGSHNIQTKFLQLHGIWQHDWIMWLALCSVKSVQSHWPDPSYLKAVIHSKRFLQLHGIWQHDWIMWLALCSVKSVQCHQPDLPHLNQAGIQLSSWGWLKPIPELNYL